MGWAVVDVDASGQLDMDGPYPTRQEADRYSATTAEEAHAVAVTVAVKRPEGQCSDNGISPLTCANAVGLTGFEPATP